jgi:hypothetical protein
VQDRNQVAGVATGDGNAMAVAQQISGEPSARFGSGVEYENDHVLHSTAAGLVGDVRRLWRRHELADEATQQ